MKFLVQFISYFGDGDGLYYSGFLSTYDKLWNLKVKKEATLLHLKTARKIIKNHIHNTGQHIHTYKIHYNK